MPVRKLGADARSALSLVAQGVGESLYDEPAVAVPISSLRPADSPRIEGENAEHIRRLAELEGDIPPIVVHRSSMQVIDGMHRLNAAILRGQSTIEARFFDGDEKDAFVLAVELNSGHGLPLSLKDRIAAATRVIDSHPHWSDRMVAHLTGLSAKTVSAIRTRSTDDIPQLNTRMGRDGKARLLNTAAGRRLASQILKDRPDASVREVAAEAGISVGTVQDVRKRLHQGEDPVPRKQRTSVAKGSQPDGPSSARRDTKPARARRDSISVAELLQQLQGDPSLRFSAVGRALLRLLVAHSIPATTWMQLIDSVPVHCVDAVAKVARGCATSWTRFAEQVEQRADKDLT